MIRHFEASQRSSPPSQNQNPPGAPNPTVVFLAGGKNSDLSIMNLISQKPSFAGSCIEMRFAKSDPESALHLISKRWTISSQTGSARSTDLAVEMTSALPASELKHVKRFTSARS
jgi:hypothetical protein